MEDNIFMKGTKNSEIDKEDHSYLILAVHKCVESERREDRLDPDCVG